MKKIIFLILFLFISDIELFSAFKHTQQDKYNIYYDNFLNIYSLEYIIELVQKTDRELKGTFHCTNDDPADIYLYNDTAVFIHDQKAMWWQNYIVRSNQIAINNIDLLLQKNSLQDLLRYMIFRNGFYNSFKNNLPLWLINGLAIYRADEKLFKMKNLRFVTYKEFISTMGSYNTQEEYEHANYLCCKGIKYLIDNYGEDKLMKYIGTINTPQEFEDKFFNFFFITYKEFIRLSLNL